MASPIVFYIIPNCGLEIEHDDINEDSIYKDSISNTHSIKYTITNEEEFPKKATSKSKKYDGFMSPINETTLPSAIRTDKGIPQKACYYSFLHPPPSLAQDLNWEAWKQENKDNIENLDENKEKDKIDFESKTNKWAMPFLSLAGAYAYFNVDDDGKLKLLQVNVLTFFKTQYDLKLSGPFPPTDQAIKQIYRLNRAQPITLDFFHEIGFVASAWVRPMETFNYNPPTTHTDKCGHGGFLFYRDDGSAILYSLDNSRNIDKEGDISHIADAIQARKNEKRPFSKNNFTTKKNLFDDLTNKKICKLINNISRNLDRRKWYAGTLEDPKTLLHKACYSGCSLRVIEYLLQDGDENLLHQDSPYEWTPLMYACRYRSDDVHLITTLIDRCPDSVFVKDRYDRTPLHIACDSMAKVQVVKALIDVDTEGKTISQPTKFLHYLPIHVACYSRRVSEDVIRCLLDADRQRETLCKETKTKRCALHIALQNKMSTEIIEMLLDEDLTQEYQQDSTESIELLLDEKKIMPHVEAIYKVVDGMIPLHIACRNNSPPDTIRLLLEKDKRNETTLQKVVDDGHEREDNQSQLLKSQKKLRPGTPDTDFSTLNDNSEKSSRIMDTNKSRECKVALHFAAEHCNIDVIDLLLSANSKLPSGEDATNTVEFKDHKERCPIHIACASKNTNPTVVAHLLKADFSQKTMYLRDYYGYQPIHYVCDKKDADPKILKLLLDAEKLRMKRDKGGTVPEKRMARTFSKRNRSPLYLAMECEVKDDEIIELLLQSENFYLKGFDTRLISCLAARCGKNYKMQSHVIEKLAERCFFTLLFFDIYANSCALVFFLLGSEKMLNGKQLTNESTWLVLCIIEFSFRAIIEMKSQPYQFFADAWNWSQVVYIILLSLSVSSMIKYKNEEVDTINRELFVVSCAFLVVQLTIFLKATFLPFARFVGGLLMIFYTLVPFFIVSGLLLLAFAYGFRMSSDHYEVCPTMLRCYIWTLHGVFNGADETSDLQDILFGIIAIVILLNVLIAIVSEAWETAADNAAYLFWEFRLQFLFEVQSVAALYRYQLPRWGGSQLNKNFDKIVSLKLVDRTPWTKPPYDLVQNKKQYERPYEYFRPEQAEKIYLSHSLQADLYWIDMDHNASTNTIENTQTTWSSRSLQTTSSDVAEGNQDWWKVKLTIICTVAKWLLQCLVTLVLMICGFFTAGYTWPVMARRYLLSIGVSAENEKDKRKQGAAEMLGRNETHDKIFQGKSLTRLSGEGVQSNCTTLDRPLLRNSTV